MARSELQEPIIVLCLTWLCVAPFASFQSMLCVRDENQIHHRRENYPNATEIMSPLLVVLGMITIAASAISLLFKSKFKERQRESIEEAAGLREIYTF